MASSYSIRAVVKRPWFFPDYMAFEILETYDYWDDPTYGNGGGDWRKAIRTVAVYTDEARAIEACAMLNKYKGENE